MRFSKVIFLLFTLFSIQQPSFADFSHGYTDAQPLPMLWLNSFANKNTDFRLHLENSSVKEYIYSGVSGEIVSSEKGSAYSYEIGYRYGTNQHIGVQFGQTGLPLLNIALSLNYQYDFNLTEKSKLLLIAMYGGFIYPGIRWSAQATYAYQYNDINYFLGYTYLKSKRNFESLTYNGVQYLINNRLEYDLDSRFLSTGFEFNCFDNLNLRLSYFYEDSRVSNIKNEKYSPSFFSRGDGSTFVVDLIFSGSFSSFNIDFLR